MPRKWKTPEVRGDVLNHFAREGPLTADVDGAMRRFKKALLERALGGKLTHQLRYHRVGPNPRGSPITATARAAKPS